MTGGFFLWLSGVDRDLLAQCKNLNRTERLRFSGLGALILVPSVLGAFSMSYAISTISDEPMIFVTLGIVWGLVVLVIDRYLVSTVYKSKLGSTSGRVVSIAARYVFAIFVGVAVSHPLVLLWFDDSITQKIDENRREQIQDLREATEAKIEALPAITASTRAETLTEQLNEKTAFRDCLIALQADEQAGVAAQRECGSSSGKAECGPRCNALAEQIDRVSAEVTTLQSQIDADLLLNREDVGTQTEQREAEIARLQADLDASIEATNDKFSSDYLARVEALHQLAQDQPDVTVVTNFIILFFVFVDILPVTMKLATPKGEYEEIRDTHLMERQAVERARQRLAESGVGFEGPLELETTHMARKREVELASQSVDAILQTYTEHLASFDKGVRKARANAGRNRRMQLLVQDHTEQIRELFDQTWRQTLSRLRSNQAP